MPPLEPVEIPCVEAGVDTPAFVPELRVPPQ